MIILYEYDANNNNSSMYSSHMFKGDGEFLHSSEVQPQPTQLIDMTLRNKRNHYNVKFLKEYGFSISVKVCFFFCYVAS